MQAEHFKSELAKLLKPLGFRKSNSTWRNDMGACIAVLNIQKSSWGGDSYYVNAGVFFKVLGTNEQPTENVCHIQERIELGTPETVAASALAWFAERATYQDIRVLQEQCRLKGKGLVMKVLLDAVNA